MNFFKMGARCSQLDADIEGLEKQQQAAARKARLIRIQLQRTGEPDVEVTIDPLDLVLTSISRDLGLGKLERATEAYLGELLLEGESA